MVGSCYFLIQFRAKNSLDRRNYSNGLELVFTIGFAHTFTENGRLNNNSLQQLLNLENLKIKCSCIFEFNGTFFVNHFLILNHEITYIRKYN